MNVYLMYQIMRSMRKYWKLQLELIAERGELQAEIDGLENAFHLTVIHDYPEEALMFKLADALDKDAALQLGDIRDAAAAARYKFQQAEIKGQKTDTLKDRMHRLDMVVSIASEYEGKQITPEFMEQVDRLFLSPIITIDGEEVDNPNFMYSGQRFEDIPPIQAFNAAYYRENVARNGVKTYQAEEFMEKRGMRVADATRDGIFYQRFAPQSLYKMDLAKNVLKTMNQHNRLQRAKDKHAYVELGSQRDENGIPINGTGTIVQINSEKMKKLAKNSNVLGAGQHNDQAFASIYDNFVREVNSKGIEKGDLQEARLMTYRMINEGIIVPGRYITESDMAKQRQLISDALAMDTLGDLYKLKDQISDEKELMKIEDSIKAEIARNRVFGVLTPNHFKFDIDRDSLHKGITDDQYFKLRQELKHSDKLHVIKRQEPREITAGILKDETGQQAFSFNPDNIYDTLLTSVKAFSITGDMIIYNSENGQFIRASLDPEYGLIFHKGDTQIGIGEEKRDAFGNPILPDGMERITMDEANELMFDKEKFPGEIGIAKASEFIEVVTKPMERVVDESGRIIEVVSKTNESMVQPIKTDKIPMELVGGVNPIEVSREMYAKVKDLPINHPLRIETTAYLAQLNDVADARNHLFRYEVANRLSELSPAEQEWYKNATPEQKAAYDKVERDDFLARIHDFENDGLKFSSQEEKEVYMAEVIEKVDRLRVLEMDLEEKLSSLDLTKPDEFKEKINEMKTQFSEEELRQIEKIATKEEIDIEKYISEKEILDEQRLSLDRIKTYKEFREQEKDTNPYHEMKKEDLGKMNVDQVTDFMEKTDGVFGSISKEFEEGNLTTDEFLDKFFSSDYEKALATDIPDSLIENLEKDIATRAADLVAMEAVIENCLVDARDLRTSMTEGRSLQELDREAQKLLSRDTTQEMAQIFGIKDGMVVSEYGGMEYPNEDYEAQVRGMKAILQDYAQQAVDLSGYGANSSSLAQANVDGIYEQAPKYLENLRDVRGFDAAAGAGGAGLTFAIMEHDTNVLSQLIDKSSIEYNMEAILATNFDFSVGNEEFKREWETVLDKIENIQDPVAQRDMLHFINETEPESIGDSVRPYVDIYLSKDVASLPKEEQADFKLDKVYRELIEDSRVVDKSRRVIGLDKAIQKEATIAFSAGQVGQDLYDAEIKRRQRMAHLEMMEMDDDLER